MSRIDPSSMSGDEVRAIRERRNLNRPEFAERIHATWEQVKKWEDGVNTVKPLTALLIRITFDPLARAMWLRRLSKQEEEQQ